MSTRRSRSRWTTNTIRSPCDRQPAGSPTGIRTIRADPELVHVAVVDEQSAVRRYVDRLVVERGAAELDRGVADDAVGRIRDAEDATRRASPAAHGAVVDDRTRMRRRDREGSGGSRCGLRRWLDRECRFRGDRRRLGLVRRRGSDGRRIRATRDRADESGQQRCSRRHGSSCRCGAIGSRRERHGKPCTETPSTPTATGGRPSRSRGTSPGRYSPVPSHVETSAA